VFGVAARAHCKNLDKGADCPGTRTDSENDYDSKGGKENQPMTSTPKFALITVVGTLAYLGLAILGWGGFAAFFSHPALVDLTIVYFVLFGIALFSGSNLSPGVRDDPADRWVVAAFWWIGLLAAYLPAYTDRIGFWTFDADAIRWLGVFLFAAGGALRIWPVFVLGHRFSGLVAIQPEHSLVTSGVYGIIRHPSYLGLLVSSLGWALAFRSGVGVLLTALTIPLFLVRIRAEERFLRSEFGRDYDVYCGGTSRLIPGVY
jgi:protein-S-isoprenylcysteine O-methyltransferase Ste14